MISKHRLDLFVQQLPPNVQDSCNYIPEKQSSFKTFRNDDFLEPKIIDLLLERGFRRFGNMYYQNICVSCQKCMNYRILLEQFAFSCKWKKRILKLNSDISYNVKKPKNSLEKQELYLAYQFQKHQFDKTARKELVDSMNRQMYSFSHNSMEINFYYKNEICGFAILDIGSQSVSAVYSVYNPDMLKRGLGNFIILKTIEWAKKESFQFLYLGSYISSISKMSYKARFKPAEVLYIQTLKWNAFDGEFS